MANLVKTNHSLFDEYYKGVNGNRTVVCILDKYSVRYHVWLNNKLVKTVEFRNGEEKECFEKATKALNRKSKLLTK